MHNMARMVVVASGNSARIRHWSDSLRAASIRFAIAGCEDRIDATPLDYAELWVEQDDVDEARSTIRSATAGDRSLLW